jgi:UbiD family decarboxylase
LVNDLRTFLENYEKEFPNYVVHVHKPIKCRYEITQIASSLMNRRARPVLIFHNPITENGEISKIPVVLNMLVNRKRIAHIIGSDFENVGLDLSKKVEHLKKKPIVINKTEAPCKYSIMKDNDVDLFNVPALVYDEWVPGPYIYGGGCLTTYDPDSNIPNSAMHRGFIASKNEIRCLLTPGSHNALNFDKSEQMQEDMKCAYWIGHHPAVMMGTQTRMTYPCSHYETAGTVSGEPTRLVPSETLGEDFLIPADAEIIIEGFMKAGVRRPEGPVAEHHGYYGPQVMSPVMEISCITHRKDAYWDGYTDNKGGTTLGTIQTEAMLYKTLKKSIPAVNRVYVPERSGRGTTAYIQLSKTMEGQQRVAITEAISTPVIGAWPYLNFVIVVDDDVDIYDEEMILWAVATRTNWESDIMVFTDMIGSMIDPLVKDLDNPTITKCGIDATKPLLKPFSKLADVPKEVKEKVRLEEFIPLDKVERSIDRSSKVW